MKQVACLSQQALLKGEFAICLMDVKAHDWIFLQLLHFYELVEIQAWCLGTLQLHVALLSPIRHRKRGCRHRSALPLSISRCPPYRALALSGQDCQQSMKPHGHRSGPRFSSGHKALSPRDPAGDTPKF